jgi:hypothetical protein
MAGVGAELEVWDRQGLDREEGVGPGQGGQGIVGHWTDEGADKRQKTMTDVAVKQALRAGRQADSSIFPGVSFLEGGGN